MSKRGVLPQAVASVQAMESELVVAEARELTAEQRAAVHAVRASLEKARLIASGEEVPGGRLTRWWRGSQVESAYLHLHVARVSMIDVYDADDLQAEIPSAVARVQGTLHRDDPRRLGEDALKNLDPRALRAVLRRLVQDGHEASDLQHRRLRSFRNVTLLGAAAVVLAMALTIAVVWNDPELLPLCFTDGTGADATTACPSSNDANAGPGGAPVSPGSWDVAMVALMGLLGGLLSAVFSLRRLRGLSQAYEAPVALAILKPPVGALTAVTGLVLVHGEFVPGLSTLDSQGQILAYAFLFGVGQQIFTRFVDQKAESILEGMPSKDAATSPGTPIAQSGVSTSTAAVGTATVVDGATAGSPDGTGVLVGEPGMFDVPASDEFQPDPQAGTGNGAVPAMAVAASSSNPDDAAQDDGSDVEGDPPEMDHR